MEEIVRCVNAEEARPVVGYMCLTDFEFELGAAMGGNCVYASIEDLKQNRRCVKSGECGIVEVEVRCRKVIDWGLDA